MSASNISGLIEVIRPQFQLDWQGIHGVPHWARVRLFGLELARMTGANVRVIECFAFLHDACRLNDGCDPDHGRRAAGLALALRASHLTLDDEEFGLLQAACSGHSDGGLEADVTVMACWDADRLDLGRVGIRPDHDRLCTSAARELATIWLVSQDRAGVFLRAIKGRAAQEAVGDIFER